VTQVGLKANENVNSDHWPITRRVSRRLSAWNRAVFVPISDPNSHDRRYRSRGRFRRRFSESTLDSDIWLCVIGITISQKQTNSTVMRGSVQIRDVCLRAARISVLFLYYIFTLYN